MGAMTIEEWLAPDILAEAHFFVGMLEPGENRVSHLRKQYGEIEGNDEEAQEARDWIGSEAAEAEYFLAQVADICLVAMFHWIERTAKTFLSGRRRRAKNSKPVERMYFEELKDCFKQEGIDLCQIPGFTAVAALRRFANSWKHQPSQPNQQLCSELTLVYEPRHLPNGYLAEDDIRRAMLGKLGGGPPAGALDAADVVRGYAKAATGFLQSLLKCP